MRKLVLVLACVSACAPKVVPPASTPVAPNPPIFSDFIRPEVPPGLRGAPAAASQDRGWALLQAGDLRAAEHEFEAALKGMPTFYPAETGLGYVELARSAAGAALPHFDRAVAGNPADRSALVGRGQALLTLGRERDALATFEAALAVDPSLADIARRVDVLRFRMQEQTLARARQAARAGSFDQAIAAYGEAVDASPASPFLYRELADVERRKGDADRALEHYTRAIALDSTDVASLTATGEILEGRGDLDGAASAYGRALVLAPGAGLESRIEALHARAELARLPAEYRAIDQATVVTRADLAALIGVRLSGLLASADRRVVVVNDLRNVWASPWIIAVTRAGVMEPFANHAFQPRTVVRRIELAQTVSRLLALVAARGSNRARAWESARLPFVDLSPAHLAYVAASQAVASGVMSVGADEAFQPSRAVSGPETIDAIARLETLAGTRAPGTAGQ